MCALDINFWFKKTFDLKKQPLEYIIIILNLLKTLQNNK